MTPGTQPGTIVVMGVSGCGKSTIGRELAGVLGAAFIDADDYHSAASIAKSQAGIALNDQDREPWLHTLNEVSRAQPTTAVMACSALKRRYRDILSTGRPTEFIYLAVSEAVARARLRGRTGHFFPESLLRSQFADLEPLQADEHGKTLDGSAPVAELVASAAAYLRGQK